MTFSTVTELELHLKQHLTETEFKCSMCTFVTDKKEYLEIHLDFVHRARQKV